MPTLSCFSLSKGIRTSRRSSQTSPAAEGRRASLRRPHVRAEHEAGQHRVVGGVPAIAPQHEQWRRCAPMMSGSWVRTTAGGGGSHAGQAQWGGATCAGTWVPFFGVQAVEPCLATPGRMVRMTREDLMSHDAVDPLVVVAAAVVSGGRLLVVSKKSAPEVFYLPGGKPDQGEEALEALNRELMEELGVSPVGPRLLAEVEAVAALEGIPMRMTVFEAGLSSEPHPAAELTGMRWISGCETDVTLAPAVRDQVLPLLRKGGLVSE